MKLDDEKIRKGEVFFGSVKMDKPPTWEDEMKFLDQYPQDDVDLNSKKMRIYLKSCHKYGSTLYPWSQNLTLDLAEKFSKNKITLIKFYGFGTSSDSYPWHKDKMDVLLVQSLGTVQLKVEHSAYEKNPRMFRPGHAVYVPRGTHHQVITTGSRVTYSYGVEGEPNPTTYI